MFKHLFKLIWNKKKQNALMIIEMFFSFMVMFAVFTMGVYAYNNYRQPVGFNYEDVWTVSFMPPSNIHTADSMVRFHEVLKKRLYAMPEITELSLSSNNVPFSMNTSNSSMHYNKQHSELSNFYHTEETYDDVLEMKMIEGRWFSKADDGLRYTPVVINRKLKEAFFGDENAVGKVLGGEIDEAGDSKGFKITGVVENVKEKGSYQVVENGVYIRLDSTAYNWISSMLVKVRPGTGAAFESSLFKTLSNAIGSSIEIEHLDRKLVTRDKLMLVPMIIVGVVGGFLMINVALGLFGVLWYNINKRKGEIGLRRAVGASGNSVAKQLVGEALVLSTLSLILGCFFAIQFPLMNLFDLSANIYGVAIVLSVIFIYLLVIVCAIYPGRQAAGVYPAIALHEE